MHGLFFFHIMIPVFCFFVRSSDQLMVNWWFGAFGGLDSWDPLMKGRKGFLGAPRAPESQTANPNYWLIISWSDQQKGGLFEATFVGTSASAPRRLIHRHRLWVCWPPRTWQFCWWPFWDDIWVFPKIGVPENGWFIVENPIKWMIWGYHCFWKHPYDAFSKVVSIVKVTSNVWEIKKIGLWFVCVGGWECR